MSISFLGKSGMDEGAASPASTGRKLGRLLSRRSLYRRLGPAVIVILALSGVGVSRSMAQGRPELKRPEEVPPEKPPEAKKKKNQKGPRAVGLLQLSNGKATLIPIAILIDGRFYDAGVYKADPVPMALEGGTVYEAEQAGESQGLFTVHGALHSQKPGDAMQWMGSGSYVLNGAEVAKTRHKAEDRPVGLDDTTDAPPRLTRGSESKPAAASDSGSASASNAPASGGPSSNAPTSKSPSSNGPAGTGSSEKAGTKPANGSSTDAASGQDPQKASTGSAPADDQGAKGQAAPGQAAPSSASQRPSSSGPAPQGQSSQDPSSKEPSSKEPASRDSASQSSSTNSSAQAPPPQGQNAENYYRPTLRRGKPTETAPATEQESAPKVDKSASPGTAATAAQAPMQLVPAISDAGGPDPQSYKFFWKEGEEDERRQQMLALASAEVRAYVTAREKGVIPAKPASKNAGTTKAGTTAHRAAAKPPEPVFENIQFRAFDVWKNNQGVMVFCAEAHLAPTAGSSSQVELYNVAIAAKSDIYGNLHKLYSGVTDKFHLDVTPRLELIDAVDADGDGRGELLFRETTDAGSGYVIYRATADKLWKMFDSLAAE